MEKGPDPVGALFVSSYVLRRQWPGIAKYYSEECAVVALFVRRILWRRTARGDQTRHRTASHTTLLAAYPGPNSEASATHWSFRTRCFKEGQLGSGALFIASMFGDDQGDIVALLVRAEAADFVHDGSEGRL